MTYYQEQLKNAQWQAMRLKVLDRDRWTCQLCCQSACIEHDHSKPVRLDPETTLTFHVHHTFYRRGRKPWEYPLESLIAVCSECHESETVNLNVSAMNLIQILKENGFTSSNIDELADGIRRLPHLVDDSPFSNSAVLLWCCWEWKTVREMYQNRNRRTEPFSNEEEQEISI